MKCNLNYCYSSLRDETSERCQIDCFDSDKNLKAAAYSNATVLPAGIQPETLWSLGGIIDKSGKYIHGTGQHNFSEMGYDYEAESVTFKNDTAVFLGYIDDCYGHAITDSLRFIWYLQSAEYKLIKDNAVLICISPRPLKPWHYELFALAGVDLHKVHLITAITQFNRVIIPDASLYHETRDVIRWTKEYKVTIDSIISSAIAVCPPKSLDGVYFSRGKWGSMDYGDKYVEKLLSRHGVTVITPEELSLTQQISILQSSSTFIATDGSIGHNALFCRDNSKVILLRKVLTVNPYSCFILQMKNADSVILDCSLSVISDRQLPMGGPYFIYPNEQFCAFFGIKGVKFPWREFKMYIRNIWRYKDSSERLVFNDTYASQLSTEIHNTYNQIRMKLENFVQLLFFIPVNMRERVVNRLTRLILYQKIV